MTMKSPGWVGMVGLDARLSGIALRPDGVAAPRAGVMPGREATRDETRGVALFAVALFAVVFEPVLFFADTVYLPALT